MQFALAYLSERWLATPLRCVFSPAGICGEVMA